MKLFVWLASLGKTLGFEVFAEGKGRVTVMTPCSLIPTTPILMVRVLLPAT